MNDRALRNIVCSLGGKLNGIPERGPLYYYGCFVRFGNSLSSEDLFDLKEDSEIFFVAYTYDNKPVYCRILKLTAR